MYMKIYFDPSKGETEQQATKLKDEILNSIDGFWYDQIENACVLEQPKKVT